MDITMERATLTGQYSHRRSKAKPQSAKDWEINVTTTFLSRGRDGDSLKISIKLINLAHAEDGNIWVNDSELNRNQMLTPIAAVVVYVVSLLKQCLTYPLALAI